MQYETQLKATVATMMATGKGLLAADESSGTIAKRFDAVGIENTGENRRLYRQMLIEAEGIGQYLSGIILYDETIRQSNDSGVTFAKSLAARGIVPGIKVDSGAKDLALHPGEKMTEGLDGLRERFAEYAALGAGFAKWRAVVTIDGDALPSQACYEANAQSLALYAALAQEAGIVPVVEPEVLLDGSHSIERCSEVSATMLQTLFAALASQNVILEGVILKASMVLSGSAATSRADVETVAAQTITCLQQNIPQNLGGVVFLSGGQTELEATAHLNAMHKAGALPWPLSFSYSRAIQNPVLKLWAAGDKDTARSAYQHRLEANSLAARGTWSEAFETKQPY